MNIQTPQVARPIPAALMEIASGWRHVATVVASTAVIFTLVTGYLVLEKLS